MFCFNTIVRRQIVNGAITVLAILGTACGASITHDSSNAENDDGALYRFKCGSCHSPFPAHSYNDGEWQGAVRKMAPLANLTPDETSRILNWLQENN
jgi:hypothetical protein